MSVANHWSLVALFEIVHQLPRAREITAVLRTPEALHQSPVDRSGKGLQQLCVKHAIDALVVKIQAWINAPEITKQANKKAKSAENNELSLSHKLTHVMWRDTRRRHILL